MTGNNWVRFPINCVLTESSIVSLKLKIEGQAEIVGIGMETDTKETSNRIIRFSGTQEWGLDGTANFDESSNAVEFPVGKYITGQIDYLYLLLDYDSVTPIENKVKVVFSNIRVSE